MVGSPFFLFCIVTVLYSQESTRVKNPTPNEYAQYRKSEKSDFALWQKDQKKQLELFSSQMKKRWGSYRAPDNRHWVEYDRKGESRLEVDFKEGVVTVEVLLPPGTADSIVARALEPAIERVLQSKGSAALLPLESDSTLFEEPLLTGMVSMPEGVAAFVKDRSQDLILTHDSNRVIGTVTFPLVPDHLAKRAARYLPFIEQYAREYNVDKARVLATIHVESFFNPAARSDAGAIGLMQLMPQYGALEAYHFITGRNAVPDAVMLLNPEENIRLGCAYIHLLDSRYFGGVVNKVGQIYCSVAAYNTGPANVARAFTGGTGVEQALPHINRISDPEELYSFLCKNLPYLETREYLPSVVDKMKLYGGR